jgi:protein involved in polysaccharide export with SLBB domain
MNRLDLSEKLREAENILKTSCKIELSGNMRVKDAILSAGGLTENAYLERGEIVRMNDRKEYATLYFNVTKALTDDPRENLLLQENDRIVIHSIWEQVYKKSVFIDGEVTKPGPYQYTEKMTVKDLVFKAGNILESAYLDDAEITSMYVESGRIGKMKTKNISLKKALEGDVAHNIRLMPYDRLFVKRIPEWREVKFASISGEVMHPGKYVFKKGERLSSLIERAGGYSDRAYLRGAYFTRERVRALQQKSLEEVAQRLERELLAEGAIEVSSSLSPEEAQSRKFELEQKQRLIETMRKLKATGRMTIALTDLPLLKSSEYDIELEDGDSLNIPEKNNVINVVGAVMSPGSIIYSKKMRYDNYINATGGYAKYADPANAFVLKVDGSAHRLSRKIISWSDTGSRWEYAGFGGKAKMLEPGDVIVVPEKIDKIAWLREIRDITQILMNAAVVAGVAVNLFD